MVFQLQILGRLAQARRVHGFALLLVGVGLLSACGQKGPLFTPMPPAASVLTPLSESAQLRPPDIPRDTLPAQV